MLTCRFDDPDETAEGQEETALTEGEWRRLESTMRIDVERFAQAEWRLERGRRR